MAEGNGVDLGSIYGLLRDVAATVSRQDARLERLDAGVHTTKADVVELHQTVANYHATVPGHGIMISELEDRVRRIECHLELPPVAHG